MNREKNSLVDDEESLGDECTAVVGGGGSGVFGCGDGVNTLEEMEDSSASAVSAASRFSMNVSLPPSDCNTS